MSSYSLRRRLVATVTGVMCAVFIGVGILLYVGVRNAAWAQHDENLRARARALAAIAEHDEDGYEMELPPRPRDEPASYVEVWKPDGSVLAHTPVLPEVGALRLDAPFFDLELPDGRPGRAVVIHFEPRNEGGVAGPCKLMLASGIEDVEQTLSMLRWWFAAIGIAALAAIAALAWWVVGRGLAPLERLAEAIDRIDDTKLSTRLPLDDQPLELLAPMRKLNDLLGRLDTSFARERQFTADVSHELRTPLAGLRTLLEVTALADRTSDEYRAAVREAHAVVLELGALVENLLMLARLDAGHVAIETTSVVLRDVVDACWKPYAAQATARSIAFRNIVGDIRLTTDREKLRLVICNLLANAAEYTESGGWIEVASTDELLLTVTDSGPALPDTHKVFDRLWRGDAARTATGVHCGIGLSLARSLCVAMSLALVAENRTDGSVRFSCAYTR